MEEGGSPSSITRKSLLIMEKEVDRKVAEGFTTFLPCNWKVGNKGCCSKTCEFRFRLGDDPGSAENQGQE